VNTPAVDYRLLLEMVRGDALLEELKAEGFTSTEISAARAKVTRERTSTDSARRQGSAQRVTAATSSSVAVTEPGT
jgi:hypothetical protein